MGRFDGLVGKFLLAGLLLISLFSYIVVVQEQNGAPDGIIRDPVFNDSFSNLNTEIGTASSDAEEKYGVFNSEDPKPGFGSIVLFGIVSAGKTFSSITFGLFGALIKLPLVVLGVPSTIYSILITWLIIIVIVAVWLLYKLGG